MGGTRLRPSSPGDCVLDTSNSSALDQGAGGSRTVLRESPVVTYAIKDSVTLTVAENDSIVVLVGGASYRFGIAQTAFCKITESAVERVAEASLVSPPINETSPVICNGVITGVPSGSHTYDLEARASGVNGDLLHAWIVAVVLG